MPRHAPSTRLITHEVFNQPPDFAGRNLFTSDPILSHWALREGGDWVGAPLAALGAELGREEVLAAGEEANRYPPELTVFDRYGRRIDEVRFHPSYHRLMDLAMEHRIHSIAWAEERPGAHVAHAALLALFSEVEQGTMCPISMTYASVPALRHQSEVAAQWVPKIIGGRYDAPLRPIAEKRGVTIGMAMTEKQGGSDVRANTTRAFRDGEAWRLVGHKWFCSAPMCDAFLTLAQTEAGLSCFLVPRIRPDGERNSLHVMRLKDKLGNKSNASSEIEYHDTHAVLLGEEGRGVSTIIEMVHHTRLDTIAGTIGIMRMALAQAHHHVANRRAFQKTLIDQPAMRAVVADLALEYEAAVALTCGWPAPFRGRMSTSAPSPGWRWRWRNTGSPSATQLRLRMHGVPWRRRLRGGEPAAAAVPRKPAQRHLGGLGQCHRAGHPAHASARAGGARGLRRGGDGGPRAERGARCGHGRSLRPPQAHPRGGRCPPGGGAHGAGAAGALLVQGAPAAVAEAFIATRLGAEGGRSFGVLPAAADVAAILARVAA